MIRLVSNSVALCFVVIMLVYLSQPVLALEPLPETTEKTIVLPDGERICDLSGEWDAIYKSNRGNNKDIVSITQDGREFLGVKLKGNQNVGSGQKTIKGTLKLNGFEKFKAYHSTRGWINTRSKLNDTCNQIDVKITGASIKLTRDH